ncbi:MAG: selenocysteine-specific translation elongation factor [Deltaproteobacteria bacterium]|nr:selenocysteine-specific translation elongation factor [Deltaproteobacteria bacterium]
MVPEPLTENIVSGTRGPRGFVIGTAGHIDHGKTALIRALTGVETDRLPEEVRRGITIDLGFVHTTRNRLAPDGVRVEGDVPVSFIDVPGHERFIRTMVAGAQGVDAILLAVAANEGMKPQTREHLSICDLLGIDRGIVVLTKSDAVETEELEKTRYRIRAELSGHPARTWPMIACSAHTGRGIDALRRALCELVTHVRPRPEDAPLRLPVDRVFSFKGFGTIATGTLVSGHLRVGDELETTFAGKTGRVRGIHVRGQSATLAVAGDRTAVNLPALAPELLERGDTLVRPGQVPPSRFVEVLVTHLPANRVAMPRLTRGLFHALTAQVNATVRLLGQDELAPGQTGAAVVELDSLLPLLPGDRFVLRGYRKLADHGTTTGGGEVVNVDARKPRGAAVSRAVWIQRFRQAEVGQKALMLLEDAPLTGRSVDELAARLACSPARLLERAAPLVNGGQVALIGTPPERMISNATLDRLATRLLTIVRRRQQSSPLESGMGRESLRASLGAAGRPLSEPVFDVSLKRLQGAGQIVEHQGLVRTTDFKPAAEERQRQLLERVHAEYARAGLQPPLQRELEVLLAEPGSELAQAIGTLVRQGQLTRVAMGLHFDTAVISLLEGKLRAFLDEHGAITPQQWKTVSGVSRKYRIPLAEHFDARRVTIRVGDLRRPWGKRASTPAQGHGGASRFPTKPGTN